jgi:hypothetical protein
LIRCSSLQGKQGDWVWTMGESDLQSEQRPVCVGCREGATARPPLSHFLLWNVCIMQVTAIKLLFCYL